MNARIRPSSAVSKKQKEIIRGAVSEELERQREATSRRIFKLVCLSLHQEFGFGRERLLRLLESVTELTEEREHDEIFWHHVDVAMEQIGLEFDKENYKEMEW